MKLTDIRRLGWDTETTGPDPLTDRIVTAAIHVRGGGHPDLTYSYLIDPGVPIPTDATAVHGIDTETAQMEGWEPKNALEEIATLLAQAIAYGMPVVAFNQSFDWSILHYDLERHGLATVLDRVGAGPLPLIDPHVIDRQTDKYVKGAGQRKLKPTAERYGVELEDWHTAEADALAALLIAEAQFEKWPHLGDMGPQQLYAAQRAWRAEQQAGLQRHFRKSDPEAFCAPEWPLLPQQRGGA